LKKQIVIIGGGASALLLASELSSEKYQVTVYEKNTAPGRKFLVAGDGGFNLTHSETPTAFLLRYTPYEFLEKCFLDFNNWDTIKWLQANGIGTFTGSSGRIFPTKGIKPIDVLNVFLEKIKHNTFSIQSKYEWQGFDANNDLIFANAGQIRTIKCDYAIFCLGGASWPVTGSTGDWINYFSEKNVRIKPFEASNCSYNVNWAKDLAIQIEGKALKNCTISCGNKSQLGEVVLTAVGIEGSGIYPLSPQIRKQLHEKGSAEILIDLKPTLSFENILEKIKKSRTNISFTKYLMQALNINELQMTLLKNLVTKEDFLDPQKLATHIKNLKLTISSAGSLVDAISTVGGIDLNEINENFELTKMPRYFAIGEMLDYDAPTGGYLLQSCFSMAKYLADYLNEKVK